MANIVDFANQIKTYMRGAEVVEGKNYFNPSILSGTVKDDITYTVNTDKSISANGTTSADTYIELGKVTLSPGTYMLSGLPTTPHLYDYRLRLTDANEQAVAWDDGEGAEFTISATQELSLRFRYNNNVVVDHITIYPMICTLEEWEKSHTYEPYYVPVKDRLDNITPNTIYDTLWQGSSAVELDTTDVTEFNLASPYTNYKFIDVFIIDNWGNGSFVTFYGIGRGHKKGLYWAEGINGTNKTAVLSHDYTNDDNAKKLCLKVIIADGSSSFYPQAKSKVTAILGRNI